MPIPGDARPDKQAAEGKENKDTNAGHLIDWWESFANSAPNSAKEQVAMAGTGILALGLAVKFGPKAGKAAVNVIESVAKVEIPAFSSVKPLADSAKVGENIPGLVKVASDSWLARIYDSSKSSVVRLHSDDGSALGSGFFVDSEKRLLATSYHVVARLEQNKQVVRLFGGRSYEASVIAIDEGADLALLKIAGNPAFRFDALKLGNPLYAESKRAAAIGYPKNAELPVISPGSLNYLAYTGQSRLGFTMKTYHGNSGGPIVGRDGSVLAVLTNGVEAGSHSAPTSTGYNVEHLRTLVNLARHREIKDGVLYVDTEILKHGRKMISSEELKALQATPNTMATLEQRLGVKVLKQEVQ